MYVFGDATLMIFKLLIEHFRILKLICQFKSNKHDNKIKN